MSANVKFKEFPKICRCCLSYGDLKPIVDLENVETFMTITNIKIKEEDKMPENVCLKCAGQFDIIANFVEMCKTAEKTLKLAVIKELELQDQSDNNETTDDFLLDNVKQEIVELEPDIVLHLNPASRPPTCENCSESFPSAPDLLKHYSDFSSCTPDDSGSVSISTKHKKQKRPCNVNNINIVEYLRKPRGRKKREIKEESDGEAEYVKGRRLKGKRRFLCNFCGKNYTRKNGLDRHMLSHSGVKPFECRECGKCYITKDTLKTHMLTHSGIKAHKCTVCEKSFTQSSHLSYHMRRHNGERPYSCSFCGKGFLSTYHLDRHKLMHTGVKPYECKQCGKQFVRSTTLRDHMLIHTGEKPFVCQHCGKQFNRKQSLTNHVLVHTGERDRSKRTNGMGLCNVGNDRTLDEIGGLLVGEMKVDGSR
ncbi:unnamed protein product [Phyllotreta striolata]|uniref:Uncharacterized protein n=1 Tax=Phyllotreta striolata TaxID=444603 RepID=A0A9N9TJG0_PHYSR|nr:unnamed protein product [Phyllotreta striolata]